MHRRLGNVIAAAATLCAVVGLAACGSSDEKKSSSTGGSSGEGKTIALLLPETKTTRYEEKDRPLFTDKVKELCPDCKVFYQNASQDPNKAGPGGPAFFA